jgi:hypothetical protein
LEGGLIGERTDTAYGYEYLGADAETLADFIAGKGSFASSRHEFFTLRSTGGSPLS